VLATLENIRPEALTAAPGPTTQPCECCANGAAHTDTTGLSLRPAGPATGSPPLPPAADDRFSLAGGVDFATGYYHRGMNMGDRGLFVQPHLTLGLPQVKTGNWTISPYVGVWNSFQEGMRGHGEYRPPAVDDGSVTTVATSRGPFPRHFTGDPSHDAAYADLLQQFFGGRSGTGAAYSGWGWYECEVSVGALFINGPVQFDLKYQAHIFPGGDVNGFQEIMLRGAYDLGIHLPASDSRWRPAAVVAYAEYGHQLAGSDGRNAYVELGIEPTWVVPAFGTIAGVSVPVTIGLSTDDYYVDSFGGNEAFGYVGVGLETSIRIAESPVLGSVFLNATVQYLRLESDVLVLANGGDRDVVLGSVGLTFSR
jgi:hypothetical protein